MSCHSVNDMPKSLRVFAVSFTPNSELSVESRTPLEEFLIYFLIFAF